VLSIVYSKKGGVTANHSPVEVKDPALKGFLEEETATPGTSIEITHCKSHGMDVE
jgi:hypothetical protein